MQHQTPRMRLGLCGLVIAAAACSEPTAPTHFASLQRPRQAPPQVAPLEQSDRVTITSGLAADSALRAQTRDLSIPGAMALRAFLDTSAVWNRSMQALRGAETSIAQGPAAAMSAASPHTATLADELPKPVIDLAQVRIEMNGSTANATTLMYFTGGTNGKTITHYEAVNSDGTFQIRPGDATFTGIATRISNACADQINAGKATPLCMLDGYVDGNVAMRLSPACSVTPSAQADHYAWLSGPIPDFGWGGSGLTVSFSTKHLSDADPVINAREKKVLDACPPPEKRRKELDDEGDAGDAGGAGGQWIIFPPDAPLTQHCFANQERTVYLDGSPSGDWYTTSIDCEYYDRAIDINTGKPFASEGSSSGGAVSGVSFTLAGTDQLPGHARAQILRRGDANAKTNDDVIAVPSGSSVDDLTDAVRQLLARSGAKRSSGDALEPVTAASKGNQGKPANQAKVYAKLLDALRKSAHKNVDAIGDAATIKVMVLQ